MSLRKIADEFALKIVAGKYDEAHAMLADSAKEEWSLEEMKEGYEEMVEYFEESKPTVVQNWDDGSAETKLDDGTMLYVPIESNDGESEAIIVIMDSSKNIIELEFGRP